MSVEMINFALKLRFMKKLGKNLIYNIL